MTVGEEGRDKADDKEGREGVGAGHVWLNVCVCGWSGFYFFS